MDNDKLQVAIKALRNIAPLRQCESFTSGIGSCFQQPHVHYVDRDRLMREAIHGDQSVVETLVSDATLLQDVLPKGFFLNKRDLHKYPDAPPPEASVVVFGGKERQDNCEIEWVKLAWR